jgi:Spy/CpxP family protein refolding chaperone
MDAVRPGRSGSVAIRKELIMTKKLSLAVGLVAAMAASLAMAQAGGGYGAGAGMGRGCGAQCVGGCPGAGPGGGQGKVLLTPDERAQFHDAMHAVKTVDECNALVAQHRQLLQDRAKEAGVAPPTGPRGDPCERMKARGFIS